MKITWFKTPFWGHENAALKKYQLANVHKVIPHILRCVSLPQTYTFWKNAPKSFIQKSEVAFTSFSFNHCIVWWQSTWLKQKLKINHSNLQYLKANLGVKGTKVCRRKLRNFTQFLCLWGKQSTVGTISRISLISGEGKEKIQRPN